MADSRKDFGISYKNLVVNIAILLVSASVLILSGCENITLIRQTTISEPSSNASQSILTPQGSVLSIPAISTTSEPGPFPVLSVTPTFTQYQPTGEQSGLFQYMLELINRDRQAAGLDPVVLNYNAAAQKHAQDMLNYFYLSHWGTDGLKPYMRYTREGGVNYEQENSAYSGWYNPTDNPEKYMAVNVKEELRSLELAMMTDDAASNWGHRDNILNKWHKRVNLGIAYDQRRLALVQQFEGDYIEFALPPTLTGSVLSLKGTYKLGAINNITIAYDELPKTRTPAELLSGPHSYSMGETLAYIIPPPSPGHYYSNIPSQATQANRWEIDQSGQFAIQADISPALSHGKGVYTVSVIVSVDSHPQNLTNYSIFVE
jgi:uncharacterized protein YkwD